jgi:hypothetical protein
VLLWFFQPKLCICCTSRVYCMSVPCERSWICHEVKNISFNSLVTWFSQLSARILLNNMDWIIKRSLRLRTFITETIVKLLDLKMWKLVKSTLRLPARVNVTPTLVTRCRAWCRKIMATQQQKHFRFVTIVVAVEYLWTLRVWLLSTNMSHYIWVAAPL